MARAYQDSHILDNLTSSVKSLQAQTVELSKAKGLHEERITNLLKQNTEQAKKIQALETRMSAKSVTSLFITPNPVALPYILLTTTNH